MTRSESLNRRMRRPAVIGAAVASGAALLPLSPATAFPITGDDCGGGRNGWIAAGEPGYWSITAPSGSSFQTEVWNAIRRWEDVETYTGADAYNLTNQGGSAPIPVHFINLASGTFGSMGCGGWAGWYIEINTDYMVDYQLTPNLLKAVAAHEFGHALGHEHSGKGHQVPPDEAPVMATCTGTIAARAGAHNLTKDDHAQGHYRDGGLVFSGTHHSLGANPGFEQSTSYWGTENGSAVVSPTGGNVGPSYLSFWPSNVNTNRVWQTTTIRTAMNSNVRAIGNFRKLSSGDQKGVQISLWTQPLQFANGCNEYSDGKNHNVITHEGTLTQELPVADYTPTTSWGHKSTQDFVESQSTQSVRVRVQARSGVLNSSGGVTAVAIDNLRVGINDAP